MYCKYCGKELSNDSNFCPNCGKKQKEGNSFGLLERSKFSELIVAHKKTAYCYAVWFLINLGLFIFSNQSDSEDFYPFSRSLGEVLGGEKYYINILDADRYDFSEFFFYTVLLPLGIIGLQKCYPYLSPLLKRIKARYRQWKIDNAKSIKDYNANITTYTQPLAKNETIAKVSDENSTEVEPANDIVEVSASHEHIEIVPPVDQVSSEEGHEELSLTVEEVKKMSLFGRFVGSIIDKLLILIIFVVGSIAVSPYGAAGRLGTYMGLMNSSPNNYEYIDRAAMNRYGTYTDGVSQYYQDREKLANEPPHIGSTIELDMSITFSFIILNLLYYFLFESILSASLGKRMLGGVLLDSADDKIGFGKALLRAICGGVLMFGVYLLFHLQMGLSNYVVICVFFLLLDLPVFFTKRSLIDICSGTTYAKR
jgi:hypothetical protein